MLTAAEFLVLVLATTLAVATATFSPTLSFRTGIALTLLAAVVLVLVALHRGGRL